MTSKHTVMTTSGPAKTPGWFSWRHQTNAAHLEAVAKYKAGSARHRAKAARQARANAS